MTERQRHRNYSVTCAGVRLACLSKRDAFAKAKRLVDEWEALGYRNGRRADVFYRDGSLVASFPAFLAEVK